MPARDALDNAEVLSLASQSEAIATGALLRAIPDLGTLAVTDEERHSWLSGMVTCDLTDLTAGQGAYGLSVAKNGRVQAELWIVIGEERILMALPRSVLEQSREAMDYYLNMEDAELAVPDDTFDWWLAHGPKAEAVGAAARDAGATVGMGRLGDIKTAMIAMPTSVPNPAEVLTCVDGAVLATPRGWEKVRIEHHLPQWGVDFEAGCYPQEASLEGLAVSFNKGCYIGQEAVFMLQKRGHVNKRLVRLVIEGENQVERGAVVTTADGDEVGEVTSVAHDETQTYAMGRVRYKQTVSGTSLRIGKHEATVSCLSAREESCG